MLNVESKRLATVMRTVLVDVGVCPESVDHVVTSLVQTSLKGVDSHGIQLFPHYCRAVTAGRINGHPNFKIHKSAPGTAILDADHGFGHHAGAVAMDHAVERARQVGIAAVAVKDSTHFGAAGYFALRASEKGCLGFAHTNADALLKAHGAKHAFTGTNPICFTAPIESEDPYCLDMATTMASWNKIVNSRRIGASIPESWACDAEGAPVTNPQEAASLQPIGEYKGYGLGMMVEILCSMLSGGPLSVDIIPMYQQIDTRRSISHFFMALDIEKFLPLGKFAARMKEMVNRARSMDPIAPGQPVLVAGDPEKQAQIQRSRHGIPMDETKFEEFIQLSDQFKDAIVP